MVEPAAQLEQGEDRIGVETAGMGQDRGRCTYNIRRLSILRVQLWQIL
jgi:hypothetical protein